MFVPATSLEELAARTPDTRDRSVDFLRAFAILAVVFGHWFIGIIHWDGGIIRTTSAVGVTSYLWLMTWFFQVMPIFFFVGGFSNYVAYRAYRARGDSTGAFIRSRLERLLRPSLVFLAIWTVVQIVLHIADIGTPSGPRLWGDTLLLRGMKPPGATVPFGPLWFLAVYLVVVVLAPVTIRLHERFRWWVPAAMVAGTVLADVIGFMGGVHRVRWFNVIFVLLFPHQLGHFLGDGSFAKLPRRVFWAMVAARARWTRRHDEPAAVEALRPRSLRMVPRHRHVPEEPARHRRRAGVERVPADGLLPARRRLVDRRRDAAAPGVAALVAARRGRGSSRSPSTA